MHGPEVHLQEYLQTYMYAYTMVCMHVYMYVSMNVYVCMYVCIQRTTYQYYWVISIHQHTEDRPNGYTDIVRLMEKAKPAQQA